MVDKKKRGSRRLSSRRLSSLPAMNGSVGGSDMGMTASMVSQMYAKVIKMSNQNKINTKNTWSLPLIDHMNHLLSEDLNFQKASCTLDASVQIYSSRVDDVWTTSFRVLENLNRSDKRNGKKNKADGDDSDSDDEGAGKKRSRKKTNTLETNPANITLKGFDVEFDVDPLFHKMSKAFDEGGAKGMLLTNLGVQAGCGLAFDSEDVADVDGQTLTDEDTPSALGVVDCSELQTKLTTFLEAEHMYDIYLCPQLESLYHTLEAAGDTSFTSSVHHKSNTSATSSVGAGAGAGDSKAVRFADATFVSTDQVELDMGGGGGFGSDDDDDDDAFGGGGDAYEGEGGFLPLEEEAPSFMNPDIARMMAEAGHTSFAHWKPHDPNASDKTTGPSTSVLVMEGDSDVEDGAGSKTTAAKKKATKKKAATKKGKKGGDSDDEGDEDDEADSPFIDFFAPPVDEALFAPPPRSARSTQLTAAAIKKAAADGDNGYLLAPDVQVAEDELPKGPNLWGVGEAKKADDDEEVDAYFGSPGGFDGNDDAEDYDDFLGGGMPSDDDDDSDCDEGGDVLTSLNSGLSGGNQFKPALESTMYIDNDFEMTGMVQAAKPVEAIGVKYARVAKQVDVRKLKKSIWSFLDDQAANEDGFESSPAPPEPVMEEENVVEGGPVGKKALSANTAATGEDGGEEAPVSFKDVMSSLGKTQPSTVTVPFYFMCVLHLANEHGLQLEAGDESASDGFMIHRHPTLEQAM